MPAAIREQRLCLRERGPSPFSEFFGRHRPSWLLGAAASILLAGVGAYGTGEAAPWTLYSYWLFLILATCAIGAWAVDHSGAAAWFAERRYRRLAGLVLAVSAATTPLVWATAALAMHGSTHPLRMIDLYPQVVLVIGFLLPLQLLVERQWAAPMAARRPARRPVTLFDRLPERLRGAELLAIEAEDHYLRIHTDRGSDLLLMRLGEAVEALAGIEGARTHRSWWVSRAAVLGASRGRGRAQLRLKCGLVAPVSRSYAAGLRLSGWF